MPESNGTSFERSEVSSGSCRLRIKWFHINPLFAGGTTTAQVFFSSATREEGRWSYWSGVRGIGGGLKLGYRWRREMSCRKVVRYQKCYDLCSMPLYGLGSALLSAPGCAHARRQARVQEVSTKVKLVLLLYSLRPLKFSPSSLATPTPSHFNQALRVLRIS